MENYNELINIEDWRKLKFHIGLDVISVCNLKCRMCYHTLFEKRGLEQKREVMELALFEKILKEFDGCIESLYLSCSAEPFMNPDFMEFLNTLMKYNVPNTNIVTNGILMLDNVCERIVQVGITRVTISIEGVTPKTYEYNRGVSIDRLLDNIETLNKIKQKYNSKKPKLRFNVIMMRSNLEELIEIVELADRYCINELDFRHIVLIKGLDVHNESLYYMDHNYVNSVMDKVIKRAGELEVEVTQMPKFPNDTKKNKNILSQIKSIFVKNKGFQCSKPWMYILFAPNGEVKPCFGWINEESMGNIANNTFDEIWNSARYKRLRAEHRHEVEMRELCRKCSYLSSQRYDDEAFKEIEVNLV